MATISYRDFASQIGVLDEDVEAFCELLVNMGYSEGSLRPDKVDELVTQFTNEGSYRGSSLEEGALEVRLQSPSSAADAAAVAERLYLMPRAKWRDCIMPAAAVFGFKRLAGMEAGK